MCGSEFSIVVEIFCDGCKVKNVNEYQPSKFPGEIYCQCDTLNFVEKLPTKLEPNGVYRLEVTKSIQDYFMEGSGL